MVKSVALTGGIGAGKSRAASLIREWGYPLVDADELARQAFLLPSVREALRTAFGRGVFEDDGSLSRPRLSALVFSDSVARKRLESITHPAIAQLFENRREALSAVAADTWFFYEAALIIEVGRQTEFDALILVTASPETRLARLTSQRGMTKERALEVMASQFSDEMKRVHADFIIENDSTAEALGEEVRRVLSDLRKHFKESPR